MWQLESTDKMLVYADELEERGDFQAYTWRAIAMFRKQIELIVNKPIHPTGSRYYGEKYVREKSDWDFYVFSNDSNDDLYLKQNGYFEDWKYEFTTTYRNIYRVNLIMFEGSIEFVRFRRATEICLTRKPEFKEEAIKIFKEVLYAPVS